MSTPKIAKSVLLFLVATMCYSMSLMGAAGPTGTLHTMPVPCNLFDSRNGIGPAAPGDLYLIEARKLRLTYGESQVNRNHLKVSRARGLEPLPMKLLTGQDFKVNVGAEISATCNVPDWATHVMVNLKAANATGNGLIRPLWDGFYSSLDVSALNYGAAAYGNTSGLVIIPLCGNYVSECDYDLGFYNHGPGTTDMVVDLFGWFQ